MPESTTCPYCGEPMREGRKWCGNKSTCQKAHNTARNGKYVKAYEQRQREQGKKRKRHGYSGICEICGHAFTANHPQTYCSVACWQAPREERAREQRERASERARQRRLPILHPAPYTRLPDNHPVVLMQQPQIKRLFIAGNCMRCGATFTVHSEGGEARYCSTRCYRADAKTRRRAAKRKVEHLSYRRIDIFRRDSWRCHICGRKVRQDVHHLHPLAATIDHLIPLSKGGADTPSNMACAHRQCNSVKSDTGGAQLLMFG